LAAGTGFVFILGALGEGKTALDAAEEALERVLGLDLVGFNLVAGEGTFTKPTWPPGTSPLAQPWGLVRRIRLALA